MQEYIYYIDTDGYDILVRDGYGVQQISQKNPVWHHGNEYFWREIYLGQGFGCLQEITLEIAREYLSDWGLDPELAQPFTD